MLGAGETRVELSPDDAAPMRSVLVYDPIGTKLDHPGAAPLRDPNARHRASRRRRVTESFEIARDEPTSAGLPGGPVRLLERRADGALAVLGESRLFDAATRVADVDTIAVGTADGVTGTRERRELTVDDDAPAPRRGVRDHDRRTRARTRSTSLLREHLYRGQNWTLAYQAAADAAKEGPQQISMRTTRSGEVGEAQGPVRGGVHLGQ